MSRRAWCAAAIGIGLTVGFAAPAWAGETTFDDTCADVYGHRPHGDMEKATDPAAGNSVMSGQTVQVSLTWPTFAVAGERANRVIECLSIDGGTPRLWAERRFTSGGGTITLSTVVPDGLKAKSTICGQSFLKTRGSFGPVSRWSEKTCFPAAEGSAIQAFARSPSPKESSSPRPESRNNTPTTRGPLFSAPPESPPKSTPSSPPRGDYQAPWPPWEKAPRASDSDSEPVANTTTTVAAKPRKAQGSQSAAPATETAPTRAPSQTLPRTGAGVVVLLSVAAVALFSGRTLRRTADHIEDNLPVDAVPVNDDEEPTLVLGRRW